MVENRTNFWRSALETVMTYVLWAVLSAATLACALLARGAITSALRLVVPNQWVVGAVDKFALFLLGVGGLIMVLYLENYLRVAAKKGNLYRRFAVFAGAEVLAGAFFFAVQQASFALLARL